MVSSHKMPGLMTLEFAVPVLSATVPFDDRLQDVAEMNQADLVLLEPLRLQSNLF